MNMTELMKDRHIDQILMCSIYVMGKVHNCTLIYFLFICFAFVVFYCFVFLLAISHSILALNPECTVPHSGPRKHEIIPHTKHSMLLKL